MAKGIEREAGTVILVWETNFPAPVPQGGKGAMRIADFYKRLEEETHAFLARLTDRAREEYRAGQAAGRYAFAFYRFTVTVMVTEDGPYFFSAIRKTCLLRAGQAPYVRQAAELFWRKSGYLCSPGLLRLHGYRPPQGTGDLYFQEGNLYRLGQNGKETQNEGCP